MARLPSGWAVMGGSQLLPGYSLLCPDPVVGSLKMKVTFELLTA